MSDLPPPNPPPAPSTPARTIRRIVIEAAFVAFLGGLVYGTLWEAGFHDGGLIIAAIIWIAGTPLLEIVRLLQTRR